MIESMLSVYLSGSRNPHAADQVGHQADDVVETFIMRFLSGSRISGLAGLLCTPEAELHSWAGHRVVLGRPLLPMPRNVGEGGGIGETRLVYLFNCLFNRSIGRQNACVKHSKGKKKNN